MSKLCTHPPHRLTEWRMNWHRIPDGQEYARHWLSSALCLDCSERVTRISPTEEPDVLHVLHVMRL